ncbi:MAG: ribosome maturation factor RimP [Actinomycetota bacterium]|jgi:ribosome maturation factor RimP|nr:ribosome maturation factor RimP [Actinomycetota bacterium]
MATNREIEDVEGLVAPLLHARGLDLYDVELAGAVLRVLVEGPRGVDLAVLGEVSGEISSALDRADPIPGRYTLEVSSPGLERPLRRPSHFAAAVGTRVRLKTRAGAPGERRVEGEVAAADDEGVTVDVGSERCRLAYDQIERAQVVFDWGPPPRQGRSGGAASTRGSRGPRGKANAT